MPSLRQFRRDARVTIASPKGGVIAVNPKILPPSPGVSQPAQLRVVFRVSKSLTAEPNRSQVAVTNLSKISRDMAAQAVAELDGWAFPAGFIDQRVAQFGNTLAASVATGHAYLTLEAGYAGMLGTIAEGNVTRVDSEHDGTDWRTTFELTDGGLGIEKGIAAKSFAKGATGLELARYLATTMGLASGGSLGSGAIPVDLAKWVARRGFVATGKAADMLTTLCDGLSLEWFVDDGELWIVKRAIPAQLRPPGVIPGPPVVVSSVSNPATIQLLRRPVRTESDGVRIESLLAPQIRLGRSVTVQSVDLAGAYRVEAVDHEGDNRGGNYITTAYLRSLSPV